MHKKWLLFLLLAPCCLIAADGTVPTATDEDFAAGLGGFGAAKEGEVKRVPPVLAAVGVARNTVGSFRALEEKRPPALALGSLAAIDTVFFEFDPALNRRLREITAHASQCRKEVSTMTKVDAFARRRQLIENLNILKDPASNEARFAQAMPGTHHLPTLIGTLEEVIADIDAEHARGRDSAVVGVYKPRID